MREKWVEGNEKKWKEKKEWTKDENQMEMEENTAKI